MPHDDLDEEPRQLSRSGLLPHSHHPSGALGRRRFLQVMAGASAMAASTSSLRGETSPAGDEPWRTKLTDHFDGKRFFNPGQEQDVGFSDFLRWQFSREKGAWPEQAEPNVPYSPVDSKAGDHLRLTGINHCSFLIELAGLRILTDPIYSERCSPVSWAGPRRIRPPGIPWDNLPRVDVVLVSHNHFDHLDLPTLRKLEQRDQPTFITGLGNRRFLREEGLRNVIELDWWENVVPNSALNLSFTPAQHWSNRGGNSRNKTLWGGFHLSTQSASVYFAGDTGYCPWFSEIRQRLGAPTLACLPIGAYKPRWFMRSNHMGPDEAVQAHLDLGAQYSIPMHYDTFQLADESYEEPLQDLAKQIETLGVPRQRWAFVRPGETWSPSRASLWTA